MDDLLFDTNCLIDIYLGRSRIGPYFERMLSDNWMPYISVISEAELWRGLRVGELERHQALITQFMSLPLHSAAAQLAGTWIQQYQAQSLGWMDALIAATAKVADLTVLTRDKRLAAVLADEMGIELYGT